MAGFPKGAQRKGETAKRPKPGCPLDKNVIADLIVKLQGNLSRVADTIGSTRGAIRGVVDRHQDLQELLKQARERQLDDLEQAVFDRAQDSNDTTLQLFILKTQGRHRGWDQDECKNAARDIATAAFDFIVNKSKNPAEPPR